MTADIITAEDRGELVSLMEPLLVGEDPRHRRGFTDLALDLAHHLGLVAGEFRLDIVEGRHRLDDKVIAVLFQHIATARVEDFHSVETFGAHCESRPGARRSP